LRVVVDHIEWCSQIVPRWNSVSCNSYNPRDLGINAYEELGLLMAEAIELVDEAKRRGRVPLDQFARGLSFHLAVHNDFFEEIAKIRAARRMWHKIVTERYGIEDPRVARFRTHIQTSGSTHTTQEPYNNLVRIALQTLAAVLGGAQSIHANGYDEGVCLPTEQSMLLSIRTEQIVALETGVTNTVDPLGGSYFVESLTNEIEERAWDYMKKVEEMGGMVAAIASGRMHLLWREAPIDRQRRVESGEIPVVGVNKFRYEKPPYRVPIFRPDPVTSRERQIAKIKKWRENRDQAKWAAAMKQLEEVTRSDENMMPAVYEAIKAGATLGEISGLVRDICGVWPFPIGL
jgi:methylmalonyl-CoA mutase N-terminal domain/subunit